MVLTCAEERQWKQKVVGNRAAREERVRFTDVEKRKWR